MTFTVFVHLKTQQNKEIRINVLQDNTKKNFQNNFNGLALGLYGSASFLARH